eukprot:CAMPEP_0185192376 /NCGR_PEP_ID=MMETSP1140-20130426/18238_1 /TAXON_ID=298111 /ORGANISM="Pavlova sp., Strain CCMP459" /LENGTH=328 /DNA_ID=CAMNT_0027759121 /DNA_START=39 /DNA_END=1023 /DNA_ORIENTATION=+
MTAFRRAVAVATVLAAHVRVVDAGSSFDLTESNFDAITKLSAPDSNPWFVKFYAPWCGHCKKLAPTWEELATKLEADGSNVKVGKVDVTQSRGLGDRFKVRGFPTLIYFADGQMYKYKGARTVDDFETFLRGAYKDAEAGALPPMPSLKERLVSAFTELMQSVLKLFQANLPGALLMVALAFTAGGAVGFALGLFLAPTPKMPPAKKAEDKKESERRGLSEDDLVASPRTARPPDQAAPPDAKAVRSELLPDNDEALTSRIKASGWWLPIAHWSYQHCPLIIHREAAGTYTAGLSTCTSCCRSCVVRWGDDVDDSVESGAPRRAGLVP